MECCTVYELYMSSEDSDYEETEEPITGESEVNLACYIIKRLPWETTSLTSLKSSLDHAYCTTTVCHCMQEPCLSLPCKTST